MEAKNVPYIMKKRTKVIAGIFLLLMAAGVLWPKLRGEKIIGGPKIMGQAVRVYHIQTGKIESIPLEEYLLGVVAAEMPVNFPLESLKAQAIAARTYTAQRLLPGGIENPPYPGADVSDDPRAGQAWISNDEMKKRWGQGSYYQNYLKIKWAVNSTEGKVMTYKNHLITAAFHASCGGQGTENSGDVWQVDLPYLKRVSCPYCSDPQPQRSVTYPLDQVAACLKVDLKALPVTTGGSKEIIRVKDKTASGRPKNVIIGIREMPATAMRDLLGLRSSRFTYNIEGKEITFTTIGYGHGVGMCQYGAKGYADHGSNYQQILAHYYPGTKLTDLANQ